MSNPRAALCIALLFGLSACDRNIEPFDPDEEPRAPDLSKIFPEGAERTPEPGAGVELPAPPQRGGRGADPTAEAPAIRGVVRVAEGAEAPADAVLFVIARGGSAGPPLAVRRIERPGFPLQFELGPEHRMIATMPFTGALTLSARLDQDGDAISRTPGDLEGTAAGTHPPGSTTAEIVLR